MVTKEVLKEKIEEQLTKWKPTFDELKEKLEQAEAGAKEKLHEQLEMLHDKRIKAEKLLEEISTTSQDAWEQVKSGVEQGWTDLTRTAISTMGKVREAIAKPKRDEEIRQIAYELWLGEGRPDGKESEHWLKAEALWQARQEPPQPDQPPPPKAKPRRRKSPAPVKVQSPTAKSPSRRRKPPTIASKEP